jgi:hypothetical protein
MYTSGAGVPGLESVCKEDWDPCTPIDREWRDCWDENSLLGLGVKRRGSLGVIWDLLEVLPGREGFDLRLVQYSTVIKGQCQT